MKNVIFLIFHFLIFIQAKGQVHLPSVIEKTEKSVFLIETFSINGERLSSGTGFFIDENGTGVSNYHIFEGAYKASIITKNLDTFEISKILNSSAELDLIVFKIENTGKNFYLPVNKKIPQKGENVLTIGNPIGLNWSVSQGIVSGVREFRDVNLIQITAPLSSGNSGSPIINDQGEVIGIATFILETGQNLNFGLHIGTLDSILTNDIFLDKTQFETIIPSDYDIAKQLIDSLIIPIGSFWTDEELEYTIKQIDNFIFSYPQSPHGYMRKAEAYRKVHAFHEQTEHFMNEAFKLYTKSLEYVTNDPEPYFQRGWFLSYWAFDYVMKNEQKKKFLLAISDFKKYGSFSYENERRVFHQIAECYRKINDYENAIVYQTKYIESIELNTNDFERTLSNAYVSRALMFWSKNDLEKAVLDFDRAIEINPSCNAYNWKVNFLLEQELYEEASSIFFDNCLNNYGHYYDKSFIILKVGGDINRAQYFIERAISEAEKLVSQRIIELSEMEKYYRLAAIIFGEQKNHIETIKALNKLTQSNPSLRSDFDIQLWIAETKYELEDYLGALKEFNLLIERQPNNASLFNWKGLCLSLLNDYHGSIASYSKAIELEPNNPQHYIMRGFPKHSLNDKSGACADWSKAGSLGNYGAYDLIRDYCR